MCTEPCNRGVSSWLDSLLDRYTQHPVYVVYNNAYICTLQDMAGDPLTERLKDQVSASIQDALLKATSVLSNLHRVQSYLDVLANLPVSRAGDIIKSAVEQVRGMKDDTTSLLQTVYLTEIGLGSLQVQSW